MKKPITLLEMQNETCPRKGLLSVGFPFAAEYAFHNPQYQTAEVMTLSLYRPSAKHTLATQAVHKINHFDKYAFSPLMLNLNIAHNFLIIRSHPFFQFYNQFMIIVLPKFRIFTKNHCIFPLRCTVVPMGN